MVLTSWLQIQNQALNYKIQGETITAADLIANVKPEATKVNLFFDKAMNLVLNDHDWSSFTKSLLIGTSTTTETPVTPVGTTELTTAATVRKYYIPLPTYDLARAVAGSVNFEIVRVIRNSYVADWVPQQRRVYFTAAISGVNVYVDVIFKPLFSQVDDVGDILFCRALEVKLAQLISKPVAGKDNPRDMMLADDYRMIIGEARMRDNTIGDSSEEGRRTWFEAANPFGSLGNTSWTDSSGRIHLEP